MTLFEKIEAIKQKPEAARTSEEKATLQAFEEQVAREQRKLQTKE